MFFILKTIQFSNNFEFKLLPLKHNRTCSSAIIIIFVHCSTILYTVEWIKMMENNSEQNYEGRCRRKTILYNLHTCTLLNVVVYTSCQHNSKVFKFNRFIYNGRLKHIYIILISEYLCCDDKEQWPQKKDEITYNRK